MELGLGEVSKPWDCLLPVKPIHIFAITLFHEITGSTEITSLCRSLTSTFYNNKERQEQEFIWKSHG